MLVVGHHYFVENPAAKSYLGELVAIIDPFQVILKRASWVADTGVYHVFCQGRFDQHAEVEPVPPECEVITRYQSIVEWPYKLPTTQIVPDNSRGAG
jgi:hypothetical protein